MGKRISFDEHHAEHLYELALEHFCTRDSNCHTCETIQKRLEKFIGPDCVKETIKLIKANGYCNKLKKGLDKKDLEWINDIVDNHKHIRAEGTRDRVKILMTSAMLRGKGIQ